PFTLMAKHVQAPPTPPAIHRPDVDPELEEVILRSLAKRPEDRYQTGDDFDRALTRVGDRICPGWAHALEPGADLSTMISNQPAISVASMPAAPVVTAPAAAHSAPVAPAYNPAPPPPRPGVARKAAVGCLGVAAVSA